MVQAELSAIGENMVYRKRGGGFTQTGTASRSISQTTPSIRDEEDELRNKAKSQAMNRALTGSTAQGIPSPVPTGNAAVAQGTVQKGLTNQGPRATLRPDMSAFAADKGRQGFLNDIIGAILSPIGDALASNEPTPVRTGGETSGRPIDRGANYDLGQVMSPSDVAFAGAGRLGSGGFNRPAPMGPATARPGQDVNPNIPTDLSLSGAVEDVGGPLEGSFEPEVHEESPKIEEEEEATFRSELERLLMDKLGETAEDRARANAGRALVAARAQAGRGQMGTSGGMLALQSDVVANAAEQARREMFREQMGAARAGTQLEMLDKAERLGILGFLGDFEGTTQEAVQILQAFYGMSREDAQALANAGGIDSTRADLAGTPGYTSPARESEEEEDDDGDWWKNFLESIGLG